MRGSTLRHARNVVTLAAVVIVSGACEWFTDFKRQPSLWTWEPVKDSLTPSRGNPQYSVPVTGMAVAGFQVSYAPLPGTIDSMANLANPHPVSELSLVNGRKYYQINCAVCHGDAGAGDGPATKLGVPGISLVTDITKGRSDGYLFGMIRNGRGLMPSYNRIEEPDRWDVVNYVRGLQGAGGRQVQTGPLAAPGVTGSMLPGPSRTAPTRPSPFMDSRNRVRAHGTMTQAVTPSTDSAAVRTDSAVHTPSVDSVGRR
jgi:mono/diheme cytochrome c family protein